jgi:hypothetical protein
MIQAFTLISALIVESLSQQPPINVGHFTPTPIRIQLSDLPRPFSTTSANKSPNVVPIPTTATLNVPQGFTVEVEYVSHNSFTFEY